MGNCVIQLGIELGLSIQDVEQAIYCCPKNLHGQLLHVMKKWKSSRELHPTIYKLMVAIQRCQCGGLRFLLEELNVK